MVASPLVASPLVANESNGGLFLEVAVGLCSISAAIVARATGDDLRSSILELTIQIIGKFAFFACDLAESDVWPQGEIVSNSGQLAIVLLDNARLVFT